MTAEMSWWPEGTFPYTPGFLTWFMENFWESAGMKTQVHKFPLEGEQITERRRLGQMAIYVPHGLTMEDLKKMFPVAQILLLNDKDKFIADRVNRECSCGWRWVDSMVDAPNRNTTEKGLGEIFRKNRRSGMTSKTYIIGGQISKILTGKYFDEGETSSRLIGFSDTKSIYARYYKSGRLFFSLIPHSERPSEHMGGRSEEVIRS